MCGIVALLAAYQNGFTSEETKCFTDMLFVDTLRGWDSTGVFSIDNDGDVEIVKGALSAPNFIQEKEYKDFIQSCYMTGMFAVGHNRAATRGTVNDSNAHPFWVEDNIVLVQNGTWNGDHKHVKDTEVDTEALAHIIHEHPDDIEQALQKIDAAYALVWYNVAKKTLYAIRNNLRPLFMVVTKNGGTLLASEASTIMFAASRNGIDLVDYPKEIEAGHLYSWCLGESTYEANSTKVDYKYRHQWAQHQQQHHNSHWGYLLGYDSWQDVEVNENKPVLYSPNDVNAITCTLRSHVSMGTAVDWEVSYIEASHIENTLIKSTTNTYDVEFVDYWKCNYQKDCNRWYMVGDIMHATEFCEKGPMVYCIVEGTEEEVMRSIVHGPFYRVKLGGMTKLYRTGKYVVSVLAEEKKEIVLEGTKEAA